MLLTIAIPTFNDYRGLSMTLQSLNMHHKGLGFEVVVFDNYGKCERSKKAAKNAKARCVVDDSVQGTCFAKSRCVQESFGQFVLVIDSHVMIDTGGIARLLDFLRSLPAGCHDIFHGPLVSNAGDVYATELINKWSGNAWGTWHNRVKAGASLPDHPFSIWAHGCGLFCVRKSSWPGYHPRCKGFGGEEGIIQEQYRARGGQAVCLPFLRWTHSFNDGGDISHTVKAEDKLRNNLLGLSSLPNAQQLWAECITHFVKSLSMNTIANICKEVLPAEYSIDIGVTLSGPPEVKS